MVSDGIDVLVDDLAAEQQSIVDAVTSITEDEWLSPTESWGWDVRDTISHLADTDDIAVATCVGGLRSLGSLIEGCVSPEDLTLLGVMIGRKMPGRDVLQWWERARTREQDALRDLDPNTRVPWGLGMRPPSFVTARMMETWAHGLDVRSALGIPDVDTDRLAHVAWLAVRALPYAYMVAGIDMPTTPLHIELTLPSGKEWVHGPSDAPDCISGPAGQFCRVFVQRMRASDASELKADGIGAALALSVARAYL